MYFITISIAVPLITALLYRTGCFREWFVGGDEELNRFLVAVLSFIWPLWLLVLLVGLSVLFLGCLLDGWFYVATGRPQEKSKKTLDKP